MLPVLAQGAAGFSVAQMALVVLGIAAIVAILFICLRWMGIEIPQPIIMIFWVLVALVVGAFAIKFVASMW